MKKRGWIMLSTVTVLILLSSFLFFRKTTTYQQQIICGSFTDAPCYLYKCKTGAVREDIGGNPSCSDGSSVINLGRVEE